MPVAIRLTPSSEMPVDEHELTHQEHSSRGLLLLLSPRGHPKPSDEKSQGHMKVVLCGPVARLPMPLWLLGMRSSAVFGVRSAGQDVHNPQPMLDIKQNVQAGLCPPARTGRDAWVHAESESLTFGMVPSKDLRRESKSCRAGTRKHGEVRSTYSTLGMARALCKRQKAS